MRLDDDRMLKRVAHSRAALYSFDVRGLYPIVDLQTLDRAGIDAARFAEALLPTRPCALQLRAKTGDQSRFLELARRVAALCAAATVPFYVNDRADVAILADASGTHVGQDDLEPAAVKALADRAGRSMLVGRSTHNLEQVRAALREPIDYLAIGPVFDTSSKAKPDPTLGLEGARELAKFARRERPELPVVAIGGVTAARVRQLLEVVDVVAVISALVPRSGDLAEVTELARGFA